MAHENLAALRDTSIELAFNEQELHDSLVYYESDLAYDDTLERPEIHIVDDTVIAVNGIRLELIRSQRFALNALRLSQGYAQTGADIQSLGFEGTPASLTGALGRLSDFFEEAYGEPLIDRERLTVKGTPFAYTLLPEVEFVDKRGEVDFLSGKKRLINRYVIEIAGPTDKPQPISFTSPKGRLEVTKQMVADFSDQIRLGSSLAENIRDSRRTDVRAIQPLADKPRLTSLEEDVLFAKKEIALATYITAEEPYTETEFAQIISGLEACSKLFEHNLRIVGIYAARFASRAAPYDELYQEGVVQLLELVMKRGYDPDEDKLSFETLVSVDIKRHLRQKALITRMPPVAFSHHIPGDIQRINQAMDILHEQDGVMPDVKKLADYLSMEHNRILSLLALRKDSYSIDTLLTETDSPHVLSDAFLVEDELFEKELQVQEWREAIDRLFASPDLHDREKIVISLYHKFFHPSLAGAAVTFGKEPVYFEYPVSADTFEELVPKRLDFKTLSEQILRASSGYARDTYHRACHKARRILRADEDFDYDTFISVNGRLQEREERQAAIELARAISPDAPISHDELAELSRNKQFYSVRAITNIFGSIPAFHKACGFETHRSTETREMSNDELVAVALELQPNAPLKKSDIEKYASDKKFARYDTIKKRFGSLAAFHEACGFEADTAFTQRRETTKATSAEDLVARAQEIKPDGPLNHGEIEKLSKAGTFVSYSTLLTRFGSLAAFHEACGFTVNASEQSRLKTLSLSNEDIVANAKALGRTEPFTKLEIRELTKQGTLPSYDTIRKRFTSLQAFNEACGLV